MKKVKKNKQSLNEVDSENPVGSNQKTIKIVVFSGIAAIMGALVFFAYFIFNSPGVLNKSEDKRDQFFNDATESNDQQGVLPQLFPAEFPIYEEARLTNNWTTQSENVTGVSVVWETDNPAVKVFNFYFSELSSKGYKVEVISQTDKNYTLSFAKENVSGFIGIVSSDAKTLISVTIGIENEQ